MAQLDPPVWAACKHVIIHNYSIIIIIVIITIIIIIVIVIIINNEGPNLSPSTPCRCRESTFHKTGSSVSPDTRRLRESAKYPWDFRSFRFRFQKFPVPLGSMLILCRCGVIEKINTTEWSPEVRIAFMKSAALNRRTCLILLISPALWASLYGQRAVCVLIAILIHKL